MALISCPECGKEISDLATACIHCGYPLNKKESDALYRLTLVGYSEDKKLDVIRGLRLIFGYGLAEAKEASEMLPHVLSEGLFLDECERLETALRAFFAESEVSLDTRSRKHNPRFVNSSYAQPKGAPRQLQCPRCYSLDVVVTKKNQSLLSVLFGGTHTVLVCHACGKVSNTKH